MKQIKKEETVYYLLCAALVIFINYVLKRFFAGFGMEQKLAEITALIYSGVAAYFLNKFYTFKQGAFSRIEIIRFVFLYGIIVIAGIFIRQELAAFSGRAAVTLFYSVCAAGAGYWGQKYWVFRVKP